MKTEIKIMDPKTGRELRKANKKEAKAYNEKLKELYITDNTCIYVNNLLMDLFLV